MCDGLDKRIKLDLALIREAYRTSAEALDAIRAYLLGHDDLAYALVTLSGDEIYFRAAVRRGTTISGYVGG